MFGTVYCLLRRRRYCAVGLDTVRVFFTIPKSAFGRTLLLTGDLPRSTYFPGRGAIFLTLGLRTDPRVWAFTQRTLSSVRANLRVPHGRHRPGAAGSYHLDGVFEFRAFVGCASVFFDLFPLGNETLSVWAGGCWCGSCGRVGFLALDLSVSLPLSSMATFSANWLIQCSLLCS